MKIKELLGNETAYMPQERNLKESLEMDWDMQIGFF